MIGRCIKWNPASDLLPKKNKLFFIVTQFDILMKVSSSPSLQVCGSHFGTRFYNGTSAPPADWASTIWDDVQWCVCLQEEFVKWKGSLFFCFVSLLVDPDPGIARYPPNSLFLSLFFSLALSPPFSFLLLICLNLDVEFVITQRRCLHLASPLQPVWVLLGSPAPEEEPHNVLPALHRVHFPLQLLREAREVQQVPPNNQVGYWPVSKLMFFLYIAIRNRGIKVLLKDKLKVLLFKSFLFH